MVNELREKISNLLVQHLKTARNLIDEARGAAAREDQETNGEHAAVTEAAKKVDRILPKGRAKGEQNEDRILEDLARDDADAKKKYLEKIGEQQCPAGAVTVMIFHPVPLRLSSHKHRPPI
jgi:hypothetical protein